MPLLMVVVSPAGALVPIVAAVSLGFFLLFWVRVGQKQAVQTLRAPPHGPSDFLGRAGDGSDRRYR